MSNYFIKFHIIPMVSAIWSTPIENVYNMPMSLFINFFQNHGLFKIKNRPQWFTVTNRSRTYVNNILSKLSGEHYKNYPVRKIVSKSSGIDLYYGGESEFFNYDKVVLATHADEALSIIENPSKEEKKIFTTRKVFAP